MKFAHIADTHIRNLKYHYEYKQVFQRLYETLKEEKPDYIIHCGDIAHTKTQISPEFVEMCSTYRKIQYRKRLKDSQQEASRCVF